MNYIKHLNAAFQMIVNDSRLNPTHVSLYMALFQLWNITRFSEVFYINRQEVMQFSKIGSKTTFHRCMQDLHNWKYIKYIPSHNIYKSSEVRMPKFGTTTGQPLANNETTNGQATASNWMLKASEIETADAVPQKKDNLRTSKNKDYGQPL